MGGSVRLGGIVVQPAWRRRPKGGCCINVWGLCVSTVGDPPGALEVGILHNMFQALSRCAAEEGPCTRDHCAPKSLCLLFVPAATMSRAATAGAGVWV